MTAVAFQGAVAALVTDRRTREAAAGGERLPGLSDSEAEQIRRLAADPGVLVTAQLVASFRLGKLLSLLPVTRAVLGNEQLAVEVDLFWQASPPTSFYFADEALGFCDHLVARLEEGALDDPRLAPVIAHERADILRHRPIPG
jgi:hypothetical protein